MSTERFQFTGEGGHQLAAALDSTGRAEIHAYALFAHCFTCGKDVLAAKRIATALAAKGDCGIAFRLYRPRLQRGRICKFDLLFQRRRSRPRGRSSARNPRAPALLIGHSLGGAAILAAAGQIPDAKAVVTIAAPSDPVHVTHLFRDRIEDIRKHGEVEVQLAGRPFHIKREFLDDIAEHSLMSHVAKLHKALLVMHSPTDDTVGIDNANEHFRRGQASQELCVAGGRRIICYPASATRPMSPTSSPPGPSAIVEPVAAQPAAAASEAPR